jgi:GNAT superfamily N-acetyltransferase
MHHGSPSRYRPGMAADLRVVELGPEHVDDYLALFDAAFREFPDWSGCYCAFYDATAGTPFDPEQDGARHRADRAARIRTGRAIGLLAFLDGVPVGWCNVAPRSQVPNLRKFAEAIVDPADEPAVVMCFVIHPDHRGKGVASALLAWALDAARRWGSPWVEGYPARPDADTDGLPWAAAFYKGPLSMYEAAGFTVTRDMGDWLVVRRDVTAG